MKVIFLSFVFLLLFSCDSTKEMPNKFVFYDKGKKVIEAAYTNVEFIDWETQDFTFEDSIIDALSKINFLNGSIDIVYENQIVLENIKIHSRYSSEYPTGFIIQSINNGKVVFGNNKIMVSNFNKNILVLPTINKKYFNFLYDLKNETSL